MDGSSSAPAVGSATTKSISSFSVRAVVQEVFFLLVMYLFVAMIAAASIAPCGPGSSFVGFAILTAFSGLMMLVRPFGSRCFCFFMLLLSLYGMWHEKETRDTWRDRIQQKQIDQLREALGKAQAE